MGSPVYDKLGPATVLIEDGHGHMGSGVLIGEDGYVLTAYHVVASGTLEGLHLSVNVTLGKLAPPDAQTSADGTTNLIMSKAGDPYKAYVHAFDPLDDVAIVKIVPRSGETLPKLPSLRIAANDPPVGSAVECMGNPGMGGLWTLREGRVEGIRDEGEYYARGQDAADTTLKNEFDGIKRFESEATQGRELQVSCAFVHGDSGGPEVNDAGEIIGLNRRYDDDDSGTVHLAVIASSLRRLAQAVSPTPIDIIPDVWRDGGAIAELDDASLDGIPETLAVNGFEIDERKLSPTNRSILVDVAQSSFNGTDPPETADLRSKRGMHAGFALFHDSIGERTYTLYDTQADGQMDVAFVTADDDDAPTVGYRLTKGGAAQADPSLGTSVIAPELFTDATQRERFLRVASSLGIKAHGKRSEVDPRLGGGKPFNLVDLDSDGKPDAVATKGQYSQGLLIDMRSGSLGGLALGAAAAKDLSLDKVKIDVSIVATKSDTTINIARDTADALTVRVHVPTWPLGAVTRAETMSAPGQWERIADSGGRKPLRAPFFGAPSAFWLRLRGLSLPHAAIADDEGIGSFPSPFDDVQDVTASSDKGYEKKIVKIQGETAAAILIDVDGHSMAGRKDKLSLEEVTGKRQLAPHFVFLTRDNHAWTFYDTDNDGKLDVVLYAAKPDSGSASVGYRIDKSNVATVDPALANAKLVEWSLFKGRGAKIGAQFKQLLHAEPLFDDGSLEASK
jgi:hypothetical protein